MTRDDWAKTAEILRLAKEQIPDEDHWWRGPGTSDGCHSQECPMTAIWKIGAAHNYEAILLFAVVATGATKGRRAETVPPWNDAPERTLEDVHDAFDYAVKLAKQRAEGRAPVDSIPWLAQEEHDA